MIALPSRALSIEAIAAASTLGVIVGPFKLPEAVWAVFGALSLCVLGLLPWSEALTAIGKGHDVYLFLIGMMVASELARKEGLFDYMAALAAKLARGSQKNLFFLIYCVGTIVTVFLSNDATAVVLTPAVITVARVVKAKQPLPYLYICAFVANAASFALPISNPANLVIFQDRMPSLLSWLDRFALPTLLSVSLTYLSLRLMHREELTEAIMADVALPQLSTAGKATGFGIAAMAITILSASECDMPLGLTTFCAGLTLFLTICMLKKKFLASHLSEISWSVLPLVAGLFILVEGLQRTGVVDSLAGILMSMSKNIPAHTGWLSGVVTALACNLINNLPAGLIAGSALATAHATPSAASAILVGLDLGPNFSLTGSLATLLWLTTLRRSGIEVTAWSFLKLGMVVTLPALVAALLSVAL
ncbi:arsenical pump membrane protein [Robbsia andropogonis]|uniref:arsenic transporter n=1 Tax=Robbsia andropogonis TaxID=28092 RepID=UPI003D2458C2